MAGRKEFHRMKHKYLAAPLSACVMPAARALGCVPARKHDSARTLHALKAVWRADRTKVERFVDFDIRKAGKRTSVMKTA
jgi:hypothetical protein